MSFTDTHISHSRSLGLLRFGATLSPACHDLNTEPKATFCRWNFKTTAPKQKVPDRRYTSSLKPAIRYILQTPMNFLHALQQIACWNMDLPLSHRKKMSKVFGPFQAEAFTNLVDAYHDDFESQCPSYWSTYWGCCNAWKSSLCTWLTSLIGSGLKPHVESNVWNPIILTQLFKQRHQERSSFCNRNFG